MKVILQPSGMAEADNGGVLIKVRPAFEVPNSSAVMVDTHCAVELAKGELALVVSSEPGLVIDNPLVHTTGRLWIQVRNTRSAICRYTEGGPLARLIPVKIGAADLVEAKEVLPPEAAA